MAVLHFGGVAARRFTVEATGPRVLVHGMFFHQTMHVTVRDARYPVELDVEMIDGKPACIGIAQIRRPIRLDTGKLVERGPALTAKSLRMPLQKILDEAAKMTAIDATPRRLHRDVVDPDHRLDLEPDTADELDVLLPAHSLEGGLAAVGKALSTARVKPHRGKRLTDKHLEAVAKEYRDALREGIPPTLAVREIFFVSPSTAGRWVQECRARGKLGPAPRQRVRGEL